MEIDQIKELIQKIAEPTFGDDWGDNAVCEQFTPEQERDCFMEHPIHWGSMINGKITAIAYWDDEVDENPGVAYISTDALARLVKAVLDA